MKKNMDFNSNAAKTKVLLVCVFNKNSTIITHDLFYNQFIKYGDVQKILIFEKNRIWKVFVEMGSILEAENALANLNDEPILKDGSKMNIYFSNLSEVSFQNNNSGGVDYRMLKAKIKNMKSFLSKSDKSSEPFIPNSIFQPNSTPENIFKSIFPTISQENVNKNQQIEIQLNVENEIWGQKYCSSENNMDIKNDLNKNINITSNKRFSLELKESLKKLDIIKAKFEPKKKNEFDNNFVSSTEITGLGNIQTNLLKKNNKINLKFPNKNQFGLDFTPIKSEQNSLKIFESHSYNIKKLDKILEDEKKEEKLQNKPKSRKTSNEILDQENSNDGVNEKNMQQMLVEAQNQLFDPEHLVGIDPSTYINPLFVIENRKSKVIYCGGLENEQITLDYIYNLFSNFGDITKMLFIKKKRTCLIEYENINYASYAKECLNNIRFFGNPMKIFFSNYKEISIDDEKNPIGLEELYIGKEENFRIKRNKTITINPPSEIIHISNLKKESCSYDIMLGVFNEYGKIENMKFIFMDQYKNMCLIKYSNVEESINALVHMHLKELYGRKIQISFTRSKI